MTGPWYILANGDGYKFSDLWDILPWIAILLIGLLVRIVTQAAKRKQAREQKERWDEIRRERAESPQLADAQRRQAARTSQDRPAPPGGASPPPEPTPAEQLGLALQRALGIGEPAARPPSPPRPQPQPQPTVLQPAKSPPETGVAAEPQLTRPSAAELPSAASARRATTPRRKPATAPAPEALAAAATKGLIDVRLLDLGQARDAIIYHEIFSAPKGLRQGREMWDV